MNYMEFMRQLVPVRTEVVVGMTTGIFGTTGGAQCEGEYLCDEPDV